MLPTARRERILIAIHDALAAAWAAVALWVAPDVSRFEAGLMALGLNLAFALSLWRWDVRLAGSRTPEDRARDRWVNIALIVIASLFLAVTVLSGTAHDYTDFLWFWSVVLAGQDPWFIKHGFWGAQLPNAYGPLFNLMAVLASLNEMAPKLLFASAYVASAAVLTRGIGVRCRTSRFATLGLMAWAWTPYAWVEVAIRGHFDVLVGVASVAAVHARRRGRDWTCAAALAVGVLLKYIPIVLVPFLALDRNRIRVRLVAASTGLIAVGMGLSRLIWGPSTFGPLGLAAVRSSTYLSIFRFLRGRYSPLHVIGLQADLDRLALPALALALLAAWWWCRARRADPATAAVLAVLVTLLLYQNGFPQYQMVLLMIASYWAAETWERRKHRTALAIALVGYFGWIAAFDVTYILIGEGVDSFEDAVGLPTFVLGCVLVSCVMWSEPGFGDEREGLGPSTSSRSAE